MLALDLLFVDDVLKLALLSLHCRNVYIYDTLSKTTSKCCITLSRRYIIKTTALPKYVCVKHNFINMTFFPFHSQVLY